MSQQATVQAPVDTGEDIFILLGAGDIPEEEKAALLTKIFFIAQRAALDRIFDSLTLSNKSASMASWMQMMKA